MRPDAHLPSDRGPRTSGSRRLLLAAALCALAPPAAAQNIQTIAGSGFPGLSADPGPALSATMMAPRGLAYSAALDRLYFADPQTQTVRAINLATSTTLRVAGSGLVGTSTMGIPAHLSAMGSPVAVALGPTGTVYMVESSPGKLTRLNGTVLALVAGNGLAGGAGDGGLATAASLDNPVDVGADGAGNVYVLERNRSRVRRIDAVTGIIQTVVGTGFPGFSGDGGPASAAQLALPEGLAVTPAGDLYIADTGNARVRVVDALTGQIDTLAGGGALGGDVPLLDLDLSTVHDVAIGPFGYAIASRDGRVYELDTDAGMAWVVAGTGVIGFSGDGGPATLAQVDGPRGVVADAATSTLFIADTSNRRLRSVDMLPRTVVLTGSESPAVLAALTTITDDLVIDATTFPTLTFPNLTAVGDSISLAANPSLETIVFDALTTVGGSFTVSTNPLLEGVLAPALEEVGDLSFTDNDALVNLDFLGLSSANDLSFTDNDALGSLDFPGLSSANDLSFTNNDALGSLDFSGLSSANDLSFTNNDALGSLDFPGLGGANDLSFTDNDALASLAFAALSTVGGSLTLTGNSALDTIMIPSLTSVVGDVTLETGSVPTLDLSLVTVGGDLTVSGTDMTSVAAQTAALETSVGLVHPEAEMQVVLPTGTFVAPVAFSVTRQDPVALLPEGGTDGDGGAASVDPIAAYQFTFAVPTLGQPATLSFTAPLAGLTVAEQTQIVAGIAAGSASLAVKGDAGGSTYQAFALCTGAQTPAADGCVVAERLGAAGLPLAPESTEIPAAIRFTGVAGSFSSWALVHTERALAAALVATIDEPITLSSPQPVAVVVHGSADVDVAQVAAASLRFGVGQVAALSATIVPGGDPWPDLLASFPVAGAGVALGDTEACLSGLVAGEAFVACDAVLVRLHSKRCGLGFELALALPLLARLRRRSGRG